MHQVDIAQAVTTNNKILLNKLYLFKYTSNDKCSDV